MSKRYRERALAAITWSLSGQVVKHAIRFAFAVVLARLLSPAEFGLLAMLTVFTAFLTSLADMGFEDALVQKEDLDESHLSSVFWAMVALGSVLTLGVAAGAPWIAVFYGVEELTPLAVLLAASVLLAVVGTVPRAIVLRRLDFRILAALQCVAVAAGGACAVTLVWLGYGVVGLVVEVLVTAGIESLLLMVASGWRPRLEMRLEALRALLGFSAYRLAARLLSYWSKHADELLVGKFLGSGPLGFYSRAFSLMKLPVQQVSRSFARAMFPSLASIQGDRERVRSVYLRTTGAVALATVPLCMGLLAVAEPFVVGVLGPHWRETVPILRILCLAGAIQGVTTLTGPLYLSQGRADLQFRLTALQTLLTIAAVSFGLRWGVLGVATGYVVATAISALPTLEFAGRLVGLRLAEVLAHTAPVFLAAAVMVVAVLGLDAWLAPRLPELGRLPLEIAAGGLSYWLALLAFGARPYFEVVDLVRQTASASAPWGAKLAHRLNRLGLYASGLRLSIWVHGRGVEDFENAAGLVRALGAAFPWTRLLFTSPEADTCQWLRTRYPGCKAVAPPASGGPFAARFFRQLNPLVLIWLGSGDDPSIAALGGARRRGMPVVVLNGAGAEEGLVRRIEPLIAHARPEVRPLFHERRLSRQLSASRPGRWLAAARGGRRISDWETLRLRLRSPHTILCLGNGPSSEDPEVIEVPHDCLMRVNYRWRERGILTRPDMVFVGSLRTTLEVLPPCVFGFRGLSKEREVLLRHLVFGLRLDRLEYFTLERVASLLDEHAGPARPSNGAAMVATAVMLRPKRLVIAGMDLYADARGRYPGDSFAENAYLHSHRLDVDLDVIEQALSRFSGEVTLLSPNLERALHRRRAQAEPA